VFYEKVGPILHSKGWPHIKSS